MPALLERKPTLKTPREEGDYLVWENVPIWKEHVSPEDGNTVFGADAMAKVAERCNDRIDETGEFVPVVIRHTQDDESHDPPVVGLAGPFKIARFGRKKPKVAVVAQEFRIHKRYAAVAARYPRLSVEYWAKKSDPTNGFFDPISLLGAETPELDLGHWNLENDDTLTRYQAKKHRGMTLHRYEMTSPAGANTAPPAMLGDDEKSHQYQKGGSLSPEDISQLVAAFTPLVKAQLEEMESRMMRAVDEKLSMDGDDDSDLSDDDPSMDPGMDPGMEPGMESEISELPAGETATPAAEAPGVETPADGPKKAKYQADQDPEGDDAERVVRYRRERDEYRVKYQKLATEHRATAERATALETENHTLRGGHTRQARYQRFADLEREGYVLEPEAETVDSADLSDDKFERLIERIKTRYQRVPLSGVPHELAKPTPASSIADETELRIKYSKLAVARYSAAEDAYEKSGRQGQKPNYNALLKAAREELAGL